MSKVGGLSEQTMSMPKSPSKTSDASSGGSSSGGGGGSNLTDPEVLHDPGVAFEGIARLYVGQHKMHMEKKELSTNNEYDILKIDAIEYPLVTINDRNIENHDIISMNIDYTKFLTTISITVHDEQESEQKILSTQMSGLIKVVMISPVDKVYKKIILNFRILHSSVNEYDRTRISYYGEFYVKGFRDVMTRHLWLEYICGCQNQGAHINANTWELLHKVRDITGLGFAATKKCKEIPDHIVRHIWTQRLNEYIEQQLKFCGTDVDNLFDAWVDLYNYIVMVNVPWVFNQDITYKDLSIIANTGIHPTSNDLPDQEPKSVTRTLTNYNLVGTKTNLEIESYNIVTNNESVEYGTLERIYPTELVDKGRRSKMSMLDIQSKQNSIDGEHIEDYNTGKRRPIPKFHFNDDKYTDLAGGYDINTQKRIRTAYFRKLRQSVLHVKLKTINFGLQRGTLVNLSIFENDVQNKDFILKNTSRVVDPSNDAQEDKPGLPSYLPQMDVTMDATAYILNPKLSGLYYIDGMIFEYSPEVGKIDQTLILIKKGTTAGLMNRHNGLGVPLDKYPGRATQPDSGEFKLEQDKV